MGNSILDCRRGYWEEIEDNWEVADCWGIKVIDPHDVQDKDAPLL